MEPSTRNALIAAGATVIAALIAVSAHFDNRAPFRPSATVTTIASPQSSSQTDTPVPRYRVIIHVASTDPHTFANQTRNLLAEAGYDDPEIRDVMPRIVPKRIEVRYFRITERHEAHELAARIETWGLVDVQIVPKLEYQASAPLHQLEVWLPLRPIK